MMVRLGTDLNKVRPIVNPSDKMFNAIRRMRIDSQNSNIIPITDTDDGLAVIAVRTRPVSEEMVHTEDIYFWQNMSKTLAVHALLMTVWRILQSDSEQVYNPDNIDDQIDIGIIYKVPKKMRKQVGLDEIQFRMGDLTDLDEYVANKIVDAILKDKEDTIVSHILQGKSIPDEWMRGGKKGDKAKVNNLLSKIRKRNKIK